VFLDFDSHWEHSLNVMRQPSQPRNFVIHIDDNLIFGLQIVGSTVPDVTKSNEQLTDQYNWTSAVIRSYKEQQAAVNRTGRVVMTAQANPRHQQDAFFVPVSAFLKEVQVPTLYMNGDSHYFSYDANFMGVPNFLRIMVSGEGKEPPMIVDIHNNGLPATTAEAFTYKRQLPECNWPFSFLPVAKGVTLHWKDPNNIFCITICSLSWQQKVATNYFAGDCLDGFLIGF
jgi:hypothetical protein